MQIALFHKALDFPLSRLYVEDVKCIKMLNALIATELGRRRNIYRQIDN